MGNIPWNALVFFTLYLQLLGMSDFDASLLMARVAVKPAHNCAAPGHDLTSSVMNELHRTH